MSFRFRCRFKNRFSFFFIAGILFSLFCMAKPPTASLDSPSGRYQDDNPPLLFKWSLFNSAAASISLKVFRLNADGTYNTATNLIARFDLPSDTTTLPWAQEPLPVGKYAWTIQGYNETQANAFFTEENRFTIEPSANVDLRTQRAGLLLGFSRGTYSGSTPFYTVDFKTTPTVYGAFYGGGDEQKIWNIYGTITDFTLRGSVRQTFTAFASGSYSLLEANAEHTDLFLGASARILNYPRTISNDGVTLTSTSVTQFNPGVVLTFQKKLPLKITSYVKILADIPVFATEKVSSIDLKTTSFGVIGGVIFGQFWPLAFGAELRYQLDNAQTQSGSDMINVKVENGTLLTNTTYIF